MASGDVGELRLIKNLFNRSAFDCDLRLQKMLPILLFQDGSHFRKGI